MKKNIFVASYILLVIILSSCAGRNNFYIPTPDFNAFQTNRTIEIGNIIETKGGTRSMPEWLRTFLSGGIEAVERLDAFNDKYVFIGVTRGENFTALNKWAENFTVEQDFTVLAANRIEERMVLNASLYPDNEYGRFFEIFIKDAYGTEYQYAVKEDTYWIKHSTPEVYHFFILITINKNAMQTTIRRMLTQAHAAAAPTGFHAITINRLRQNFFEGF
jgi:hypothetical protein